MPDDAPAVLTTPAGQGATGALATFAVYILAVFALAYLSGRMLKGRSFLGEYFLGSRSLGMWAFALTFAATSASGGSFMGFPSLVYTHGWVLALWIGSYLVVPIFTMGLLAKRINQIARRTGAITIPDVVRDRFESPTIGVLATLVIVVFMAINLIAQFKGGSIVVQALLEGSPLYESAKNHVAHALAGGESGVVIPFLGTADAGYLIALGLFAVVVVVYTAYGGFRAVVWTDVMQGFVMVAGVVIMLPVALWAVGGLGRATKSLNEMTPPLRVMLEIRTAAAVAEPLVIPNNSWLVVDHGKEGRSVFRTASRAMIDRGQSLARRRVDSGSADDAAHIPGIQITYADHIRTAKPTELAEPVEVAVVEEKPLAYGQNVRGTYVTGPGPHATRAAGFLPLGLAFSFFFMWTFSGAGQPSSMVRLMAFQGSGTLRRAIVTVAIYFSLIYFPIVIIFCCARVLMPGWETQSDRIMPEMAKGLMQWMHSPWLAGLLLAAPFAAVMSTVDSFLLMISSALVRDVYQRNFNPRASDKTIKRLTYTVTLTVGALAVIATIHPPAYLQDVVVYTTSGLSVCFLAPVALALYWPRVNKAGAIAGMVAGLVTHTAMYGIGFAISIYHGQPLEPILLADLDPFLVGLAASVAGSVIVTLITPPPPEHLVKKFFHAPSE